MTEEEILKQFIRDKMRNVKDGVYHVTELLQPPCIRQELKKHKDDITVDIRSAIASLTGIIGHEIFQTFVSDDSLNELSIHKDVTDNIKIVGRMDSLYGLWLDEKKRVLHASIKDYKTSNANSIKFLLKSKGPKDEWVQQLNIYKWITETEFKNLKGSFVQRAKDEGKVELMESILKADRIVIDKLDIVSLILDYSPATAQRDKSYPRSPFNSFSIPVASNEEIEKFVMRRLDIFTGRVNYIVTDEDMWTRPWLLMSEGRKSPLGRFTTTDAKNIVLMKGQYLKFDTEILKNPAQKITRCMYCPAKGVCNIKEKPYYKLLLKEAQMEPYLNHKKPEERII